MKRKLTIIAALLLSVVSFAQKKGEMNVGGGISLDGLSSTEESSTVKSGWNKSGSTHTTPFTLKDASFGIHADFSIFVTDCDSHLNQIDVKRNSRSTSVGFGVSSSTYSPTLGFRYWF